MNLTNKFLLASLAVILGGVSIAFAAEPPPATATGPSKEMRERMATFHEQLAACLRSEKPIAECHKAAMQHHKEMMGEGGCPMMDMDHAMPKQSGKTEGPK